MTTAHRPTWAPAKGGEEQGGMRFYAPSQMRSVKDTAGYTKMKYRQEGQGNVAELLEKDLKASLEEKERQHFSKLSRQEFIAEREEDIKLLEGLNVIRCETIVPSALDADEEDLSASSGSSSDEEDEEAELLAELDRIRKERAEEEAKKEALKVAEEEEKLRSEAISGNPLLQEKLKDQTDFRIKRKWDDDVVFRNQASKQPIQRRRFINDTIRNDFHKRFLDRYMK